MLDIRFRTCFNDCHAINKRMLSFDPSDGPSGLQYISDILSWKVYVNMFKEANAGDDFWKDEFGNNMVLDNDTLWSWDQPDNPETLPRGVKLHRGKLGDIPSEHEYQDAIFCVCE